MRFNRIMNTILQLRKFAASAQELDKIQKENQQIYDAIQKKLNNREELSEREKQFLEKFNATNTEIDTDTDEFIDDSRPAGIIENSNGSYDYNFRNTDKRPLSSYNRILQIKNDSFSDVVHEVIENPLFPFYLKENIKQNRLSDEMFNKHLKEIELRLKSLEPQYNQYKDEIENITRILSIAKKINQSLIKAQQAMQRALNTKNQLEQQKENITAENEEINTYLDKPRKKGGTFRDQIKNLNTYRGVEELFKVGSSLEVWSQTKSDYVNERNEIEAHLNELKNSNNNNDDIDDSKVSDKEKRKAFKDQKEYERYQDPALRPERLKERIATLNAEISKLNSRIHIAEAIVAADSSNNAFDYTSILSMSADHEKEYNETLLDQGMMNPNFKWNVISSQISKYIKYKNYADRCETNNSTLSELNEKYRILQTDIAKLSGDIQQLNTQKKNIEEQVNTAEQIQQTTEYKDRNNIVTDYLDTQAYLMNLLRIKNILSKGTKDNKKIIDESAHIDKLSDKIELLTTQLSELRPQYEKAKNSRATNRSLDDENVITQYEKAQKKLETARADFTYVSKSISQKLDDVDMSKIDTAKIAEQIIRQITADKSLLGILLTQSVDKFVMTYLKNNNYVTPNLTKKIKLLHYYLSDEDGMKKENIHLQDIKQFKDSDANEQLLLQIAKPLLEESKDNIVTRFFNILKRDYNDIYKACYLNLINTKNKQLFVVNEDNTYRKGPFTKSEIENKYNQKDIKVNSQFTIIDNNGDSIRVQVITDMPTGVELLDLLDVNSQQGQIWQIFKSVQKQILEYIRTKLQEKAFAICNNTGNNFYSTLLVSSVSDVLDQAINMESLAEFCVTSDKNSRTISEINSKENIQTLMDELIQQLCQYYHTDDEYIMFTKFLQHNNVVDQNIQQADEESNSEYKRRLRKIYKRPLEIFKTELKAAIDRRIRLCKKEYQARDKKAYDIFISRQVSDERNFYYQRLNGYTDENGKEVKGLISEIKDYEKKLEQSKNAIQENLIQNITTIDREFIINIMPEIIDLLRNNDNLGNKVNNIQKTLQREEKNRKDSPETYIEGRIENLKQVFTIYNTLSKMTQQVKEYRQIYSEYKKIITQYEQLQRYISRLDDRNAAISQQNTLLPELRDIFDQLYGKKYSPFRSRIRLEQLTQRNKKSQDALDSSEQKELKELSESQIFKQSPEEFMQTINESNYRSAGLYGQLRIHDLNIEKIKNSNLTDKEKDKSIAEETKIKQSIQTTIQSIIQRLKSLNNTISQLGMNEDNTYDENMKEEEAIANDQMQSGQGLMYSTVFELDMKANNVESDVKEQEEKQVEQQRINKRQNESLFEQMVHRHRQRVEREREEDDSNKVSVDEGNYDNDLYHFDAADDHYDINGNKLSYDQWIKTYLTNSQSLGSDLPDITEVQDWRRDHQKYYDQWIKTYLTNPQSLNDDIPDEDEIEEWIKKHPSFKTK